MISNELDVVIEDVMFLPTATTTTRRTTRPLRKKEERRLTSLTSQEKSEKGDEGKQREENEPSNHREKLATITSTGTYTPTHATRYNPPSYKRFSPLNLYTTNANERERERDRTPNTR